MRATNRLSAGFLKSPPVGKHCDVAGLWLVKRDTGGAQWVLRVTIHGRRREMGLGGYPSLGRADARKLAERWRNVAAAGRDPAVLPKAMRDSCCESSVVAGAHEQTDITDL